MRCVSDDSIHLDLSRYPAACVSMLATNAANHLGFPCQDMHHLPGNKIPLKKKMPTWNLLFSRPAFYIYSILKTKKVGAPRARICEAVFSSRKSSRSDS